MTKHIDQQIAHKHRDIPQDALPGLALPTPPKEKAARSKTERTALIRIDAHTLAFRDHTKTVGKHTVPCPGSGQTWDGKTYVVRA